MIDAQTQLRPPPFDEDFEGKTGDDLVKALLLEVRSLRRELQSFKGDVETRLAEGARKFELQDADIGLSMNGIKVALLAKGHEEAAAKMQEAIEIWAAQRARVGAGESKTNPENEKPDPEPSG